MSNVQKTHIIAKQPQMKIPRRLKELLPASNKAHLEAEKRGFVLIRADGERMSINFGEIVTLTQWEDLGCRIREFVG